MSNVRAPLFAAAVLAAALAPALAHDETPAGSAGDPKLPARTIAVVMSEGDGTMAFSPAAVEVRKGEQVRFAIENKGALPHEFRLASVKDNDAHAAMMRDMPGMTHHEANAITLEPGQHGDLVWRFTQAGTFEFACLIPGHREAGMRGTLVVK